MINLIATENIIIPFLHDSDVIITSAPNPRQHSAILSSSVATTNAKKRIKLMHGFLLKTIINLGSLQIVTKTWGLYIIC